MELRLLNILWATVLVLGIAAPAYGQRVIYVDTDAVGANDGSSWANAFVFLQDALAATQDGDEVWVAEGVYRPDQGAGIVQGDRHSSFVIERGISLYGGFVGREVTVAERDADQHVTILSADLLGNDEDALDVAAPDRVDNASLVVQMPASGRNRLLDGVFLAGGNHLYGDSWPGGAIYVDVSLASVNVSSVSIERNASERGAIVFVQGSSVPEAKAEFAGVQIISNAATRTAGIITVVDATFSMDRSTVSANRSEGNVVRLGDWSRVALKRSDITSNLHQRAPIFLDKGPSLLDIVNCRIVGNSGTSGGTIGAVWALGGRVRITNSLVSGNSAHWISGGLYVEDRAWADVTNSLFANNSTDFEDGGGAVGFDYLSVREASATISNTIFWQNDAPRSPNFASGPPNGIALRNSIVEGLTVFDLAAVAGEPIEVNPQFRFSQGMDAIPGTIDDDYRLLQESPAIDAGSIDALPADSLDLDADGDTTEFIPVDLIGRPRLLDGGSGFARVDIGPYEFDAMASSTSGLTPRVMEDSPFSIFPSPIFAGASVYLQWNAEPSQIELQVIDVGGRIVRRSHYGWADTGQILDLQLGRLAPGVYAVRDRIRPFACMITISR